MSVHELAFDRGEQALGRRVVVRGPDAAHRGGDPRLLQSPGERKRDVLRSLVRVVHEPGAGRRRDVAMSSASTTSSVRRCEAIDQPTMRLLQQSRIVAR